MTSPRSYDGVGYPSPSFSSGTPIYDSLVAERGVPQIAPINVPAALPPASSGYGHTPNYGSSYGSTGFDSPGSSLPALPPARLALGPGPSSSGPATQYIPVQPTPAVYTSPQPQAPAWGQPGPVPQQRPAGVPNPAFQQYQPQGYATAPTMANQGAYAGAQQGFASAAPAPQGFADQSFGGNQFRPAAPVRPVAPQTQYPQPGYQGNAY
ncbi:DUF6643 family protein [Kitasatospora sp. NPDC096147]|uniref:DUF6643 family protein n=1 Tax=Kitasatospora sp. NPDC096147 TaxID=3364093 RepID=UPI00382F2239